MTRDQLGAVFGAMRDLGHDNGRIWVRLDLIELADHTGNSVSELAQAAGEAFLRLSA